MNSSGGCFWEVPPRTIFRDDLGRVPTRKVEKGEGVIHKECSICIGENISGTFSKQIMLSKKDLHCTAIFNINPLGLGFSV